MEAKFTPGPWQWDGYKLRPTDPDPNNNAVHTIVDAEYIGWGFLCSDPKKTLAESNANLLLIQAAPDLVDAATAAEAVLAKGGWLESSTDPEAIALFKLRAALAKACGDQS
ncbi:hypothetical protein [Cupriavidus nantongensis]|uniref:Uncharacterized protein n=1 Tax=Cupriavidus nantongensis TaxID=1796606 RepID=A0A142JHS8_9BURK|nr:hypothetical protein [Cupriavidus nantongensis]AMR77640.1 hypothetical protein A2G96_07770 [Cupriavidus nantongensis]